MRTAQDLLTPTDLIRLYGSFHRRLAHIVRSGVGAPEPVVEDACQVAWTALICQSTRVDRERAAGWLVRTAIREALSLMRIADREDSLARELEVPIDPGPEELAWRRSQVHSLRLLSLRQQRLVWLRALGLSYEEMASYERCTNRTVRRQLERARRRLRVLDSGTGAQRRAA